ncbi:P-loop containing nucleoside triphosphate hydrolase protein [Hypoxylon sp. NC1633]|nr:P-loop containing nucleoside triphosphate hydrolase protein [Hypoxylon sp. NC1633]
MTSMEAESVATILCTSKQTRFNIRTPDYREIDVEGLNITVTSGSRLGTKNRGKAKSDGTEILSNAKLRLKAGQRYALVGRNGTGKSTLLKAIAEKLIPGIPDETRIAILQQTDVGDANTDEDPSSTLGENKGGTVLEEVIEQATAKQEIQREIEVLSKGVEGSDPLGALKAFRKVHHGRLHRDLFLMDKDARLRSGARGMQARKSLIAMEKKVAEFESQYEQRDEDIPPEVLAKETSEAADMLADLQLQAEPSKLAEIESRAKKILAGLGFTESRIAQPVSNLSGGWKMRTALAAALLQESDILILDEPTNFLDLLGIVWLQRHLTTLAESPEPPTLVLVSHDRDFISLCTDLLIIKDKDLTYFHGDLPTYEAARAEKKAYLTKMKEAQDRQKAHMQQTIQRNLREGKARDDQNRIRQAKSRQKKLDDRWGMQVSAKGGRFKLNRDLPGYHLSSRAAISVPQDESRPVSFALPDLPDLRFPGALLSLEKASFWYPSTGARTHTTPPQHMVLQHVDLSINMGDRIAILGLNGSGKSTLVKLLVEETSPTSGTLSKHARLNLGYYAQQAVSALQQTGISDPDLTALALLLRESEAEATVAGDPDPDLNVDEGSIRGLLSSLGLPGRLAADVPVRRLSGGQLVRLQLARVLRRRPHCLVLDEATTHLDYESVGALRGALRGWGGAVVVVSHDRWFIRGVVEGLGDGDGDGDGESGEEEDGDEGGSGSGSTGTAGRRRLVYRLKAGQMTLLEGGVQQFEDGVERRVGKLMDS